MPTRKRSPHSSHPERKRPNPPPPETPAHRGEPVRDRGPIPPSVPETPASAPRHGRTIQTLMLVLLAAPTLISTADRIRTGYGFDFYNFWGVAEARQSEGADLGDPYRNGTVYLD